MRAIRVERFGGPEVLAECEVEQPAVVSTEVLVEVHAAGVNPVDYKTRRGDGVAASAGPLPFVPGWDVAGVVVGAGYGVTRFQPGDRVFGMPRFPRAAGAYAEYLSAPSLQLSLMPEGLDFVHAAAVPLAALTVWQSLVDAAGLVRGQAVLVLGAGGGVGHLAMQLVAARGAEAIAVTRSERPAASGVDIVLDLVGGSETAAGLGALRPGGVMLAVADGADDATKDQARELGMSVLEPLVEPDGRALDEIAALIGAGALEVAVDSVFPLSGAAAAHRRLEAGGVRGKVVLAVRDQNSGRSAA
jgi:NADPH:quinone reductase-like Zn-dependent oxidoreductase